MNRLSFFKKKRVIIPTVIIGGVVAFFAYKTFTPPSFPPDKTYVVKKTTFTDSLSLSGSIDADEKADLHFQTAGLLSSVNVKMGDRVSENQILASLDQRQVKKQFQKSLNTYGKVRQDFDQTHDDNKDYAYESAEVSDRLKRLIEKSQVDLNNAVLDLELQNLAVEYSALRTPIAGIVTHIDTPYAGVNITTTSTFQVINPDTLYFSALIDQTDIGAVREGETASITLDAYPDQKLNGIVQTIGFTPQEDETGTVYETKIYVSNADFGSLRIGMTGDASIILEERQDVLTIPIRYIKTVGEEEFVQKKEGNAVKEVKIETGEETEGNIEVKKGLQEGDTIYEFTQ